LKSFISAAIFLLFFSALDLNAAEIAACSAQSSERQCMLCNCMFEASGETLQGKLAVNQVVFARMNSGKYRDSVCGVVWQRSQFSWTNGYQNKTRNMNLSDTRGLNECVQATDLALNWLRNATNPTHYHTTRVSPYWAGRPPLVRTSTIGHHIFYNDNSRSIFSLPTMAQIYNAWETFRRSPWNPINYLPTISNPFGTGSGTSQ
jgi:spore germination cell wall hydrolase CwlJ-like protein